MYPRAAPSPTRAASASNGRGLSGTLREMMALPLLLLVILAARTRGGEGTRREGRRRDGSRTPSHCSLCLSSLALFSLCSDSLSRIKARQKVATDDMDAAAAASRSPKLFRQPRALPLLADSVPLSLICPSLVHMVPLPCDQFVPRSHS